MVQEFPQHHWRLSAPESLVLLWGPDTGDAWALKVALLELVVRRVFVLSTVKKRRLLRSPRIVNVLAPGEPLDQSASHPLHAVLEAYLACRSMDESASAVPVDRVAKAVFSHHFRRIRVRLLGHSWDRSRGGYVRTEVLPELERQGLFTHGESVRLGMLTTTRWSLTERGIAALEELKHLMAIGRESFGGWVEREPERARSYVERAGSALLLLGGVSPLLQRLQGRLQSSRGERQVGRIESEPAGAFSGSGAPFALASLAAAFGPGPRDDLDTAFFTLSTEVERAWDELLRDGGLLLTIGE